MKQNICRPIVICRPIIIITRVTCIYYYSAASVLTTGCLSLFCPYWLCSLHCSLILHAGRQTACSGDSLRLVVCCVHPALSVICRRSDYVSL